MSYLNWVWMAASVAVVNGYTDQGHKWKSELKSLQHGKKPFGPSTGSSGDTADLLPFPGLLGSVLGGFLQCSKGEERRKQADESLQHVMYLNCWGQS